MFDFIPNDLREATRGGAWLNQLKRALTRKQIIGSTDILLSEGPNGTALTVSDKIKMKWSQGGGGATPYIEWDYSASISAGSIVRIDLTRNDYPIPWTVPSGSVLPPLSGPTFMCIKNVPSIASGLRDTTKNIYYPHFPTWTTSSIVPFSGSTYNDIFFREIGLPVTVQSGCDGNGNATQDFVSSIPISSSYAYGLPYTG